MSKISLVHGKNFVVEQSSLNHTPYIHGVQMVYFEIQAMIQGYHQYKGIWDAKFGEQCECQRETSWQLQLKLMAQIVLKGHKDQVGCSFPY